MKKIIPFNKEITFKTMISKVTNISLEHTLIPKEDNMLSGYFIIEGKYKMTQASQIDEEFSYKIPVDIEIDSKYDISNITLDIEEFTYEILDEERIGLNIELCIDNLEEKTVVDADDEIINLTFDGQSQDSSRSDDNNTLESEILDNLFIETGEKQNLEYAEPDFELQKEEVELPIIEKEQEIKKQDIEIEQNSLFSSFKDDVETYKAYSVYIVKEDDTIDTILKKYKINKEELEEYNAISNIKVGSKVIIPCGKNE